ncbi:hypothetical protein BDA96_07G227300 [Sorghum bicolor]|uniref:Uncharacterized protein n=3 Tax=Sorghum bicolor TaxID=4558 RepID=A0A921UAA4_SORBI|nr:hypothetical protein BDA96_07G227300 [Sorghum bicolor]OQU80959.1 hypothetical protein SORBI_3007G213925 [Sorghum bicolor]
MFFIDHTLQKMLMTKDRYGTHDGGKWLQSSNCLPLTNGRIQTCPGYSFTKQPSLQTLTTKLQVEALPLSHHSTKEHHHSKSILSKGHVIVSSCAS